MHTFFDEAHIHLEAVIQSPIIMITYAKLL